MTPTYKDAKKANAITACAKDRRFVLRFRPGIEQLLVFTDSAGPNEKGTQVRRMFCGSDSSGDIITSFISWDSQRVKNTCRSSVTGNNMKCGDAPDCAIWLRQIWFEKTGVWLLIQVITARDSTSTNAVTTRLPKEKRNRIDLAIVRQNSRRGQYSLTWVLSRADLADALTKEE